MRWSWQTTANYLFQDKKFVLSIPLNRYAIPVIHSVKFNTLGNSITITGTICEEETRPLKMDKTFEYKVCPETEKPEMK